MSDSAADLLALPCVGLSIGGFLDTSELASCEAAQIFTPYICECLWNDAGLQWLKSFPFWNDTANQVVKENDLHGKRLFSQMIRFRRAVFPSKSCRPWIIQKSFSSICATPHLCVFCEQQNSNVVPRYSSKPDQASVSVAAGTYRGQPLVIGMDFTAGGAVDDNLHIGITAVGGIKRRRTMSITFAPCSGRVRVEHENKLTMQTDALPNAPEAREGSVWVHVNEEGCIRFLRRLKGCELEVAGVLPHEMFPKWIGSYFASIDTWFSGLEATVDVSVERSGCSFPDNLSISDKKGAEIATTWSVLDEDNW